jgi:S-formylglutathione hydrolase FrmB
LPAICKSVFKISASGEDTAIIGGSMGGYGALKCALSKPEQYGMCGAFSSCCLFLKEGLDNQRENGNKKEFIDMYGERTIADIAAAFGEKLEWNPKDEILELARCVNGMQTKPAIYTACGTEDYFRSDNKRFSQQMEKLKLNFTYEEWKGAHDFTFFNEALKKAIDKFGL